MSETVLGPISNINETVYENSETFFAREVGIAEAANITGRSKGQIGRDSNSGRLTYTLNEKEQKRYKVSDLYTLYGFRNPKETKSQPVERPLEISTETAVKIAVLETELKAKEETLRHRDEEIRDLRQNRDRLIEQNQRLTLLLPAPKESQEAPMSAPKPERKGFWQRLFS
jgi:hypothetical protein